MASSCNNIRLLMNLHIQLAEFRLYTPHNETGHNYAYKRTLCSYKSMHASMTVHIITTAHVHNGYNIHICDSQSQSITVQVAIGVEFYSYPCIKLLHAQASKEKYCLSFRTVNLAFKESCFI